MTCDHCHKEDPTTVERVNPYMEGAKGVKVVEAICNTCYQELKDDI